MATKNIFQRWKSGLLGCNCKAEAVVEKPSSPLCLVDQQAIEAQSEEVTKLIEVLPLFMNMREWIELRDVVIPKCAQDSTGAIQLLNYFIAAKYKITDFDEVRLNLWHEAGKPSVPCLEWPAFDEIDDLTREHYYPYMRRLWYAILNFATSNKQCCDDPHALTPGVMSLYAHTHFYRRQEEDPMHKVQPGYVMLRNLNPDGGYMQSKWVVCTERGQFPIKAGGEPENLDILVQPFYRFEPGPEHGMSSCIIGIGTGTPGHYWHVRIARSFEILEICDEKGHQMEAVMIPADSPAISMFRIDSPLKELL